MPRSFRIRRALRAIHLTLAAFALARTSSAQGPPRAELSERPVCYGFTFGAWKPPLDWQAAGHGPTLDSARVPRAPAGRGWADVDLGAQADTSVLLFPPWWPAGILVELRSKPASLSDTVAGRARAFVADGRKQPPTSAIRAWLVPCQS